MISPAPSRGAAGAGSELLGFSSSAGLLLPSSRVSAISGRCRLSIFAAGHQAVGLTGTSGRCLVT